MDNRGLALGIVKFVAVIVIGVLLYTLFEPAASEIFSTTTSQADTSSTTDQIGLAESIFSAMLFYVMFLGAIYLVVRSVFEQSRPG